MRYRDRRIKNISALVRALGEHRAEGEEVWFRGHANVEWDLVPTIARERFTEANERDSIARFRRDAIQFLDRAPTDEWDWVFLMRHYGVPTRLIDWTENPLTALYFALADFPRRNGRRRDGALWMLLPVELNRHAGLGGNEPFLPLFGTGIELSNYLPSRILAETTSSLPPVAGIASRDSARMRAQQSVFTVNHRDYDAIEGMGDKKHVWRYIIPADDKASFRQELRSLGVTDLSLFPDLDHLAQAVTESARG